ncbi:TVA4 protein, partial [Trogon melanurus]|nr:TVA4 protein [Trogon melanurus]
RAQVQQESSAETTKGNRISIYCSHPNIRTNQVIIWYRQLPGRSLEIITIAAGGSRDVENPPGRLWVAADRRSSALWLFQPHSGDTGMYYCALEV